MGNVIRDCNACIVSCFCDNLIPLTKLWGIMTSVVTCGVAAELIARHQWVGAYVLLATIILFFLEITWVVTLFLKVCIHDEYSKILHCWDGILWIRQWKKTIIYSAFGLTLLFQKNKIWLCHLSGIMLIILALFHFFHYWSEIDKTYHKESLLDNSDDLYDRTDKGDESNTPTLIVKLPEDILNNENYENNST